MKCILFRGRSLRADRMSIFTGFIVGDEHGQSAGCRVWMGWGGRGRSLCEWHHLAFLC